MNGENQQSVLLVMLCGTKRELIEAMASVTAIDEVQVSALFIVNFEFEEGEVTSRDNRVKISVLSTPKDGMINIVDKIKTFASSCNYVCFLPRFFLFSRSIGLKATLELIEAKGISQVAGLVKTPQGWRSDAYFSDRLNNDQTLFHTPVEMSVDVWNSWYANSYVKADLGGDIVVRKIDALPEFLPPFIPNLTWGALLNLCDETEAENNGVCYSGLQGQVSDVSVGEFCMYGPCSFKLYEAMEQKGLIEIVYLGQGKLVRDDDLQNAVFQELGGLDAYGNNVGSFKISKFYTVQAARELLGPLYTITEELPPFERRLHSPAKTLRHQSVAEMETRIQELQLRSVDHFKLNRLWEVAIKRTYLAVFKKKKA